MHTQDNSPKGRRSTGTGSLIVRRDKAGRETYYGKWSANGRQVKRRIGPKRVPSTSDGLTRSLAEAELRRLMAEVAVAPVVMGAKLTVREAGKRYLGYLEHDGRKHTTLVAVEMTLRVHLVPFFGERGLDKITKADVKDFVQVLRTRGCGPKTIRNYVGTLSALFKFAEKNEWASGNPCAHIELPKRVQDVEIHFLSAEELEALLREVDDPHDHALYLTAAMTGLRQGELIALRWRDIDWKNSRVRVRQNYVRGEFGTPKSKRSSRSVPLADRVAGELERLHQASLWQGDDDLVFANPVTGKPLQRAMVLRHFKRAMRQAGLSDERVFHDLRHTFGTRMASAAVPMRTLQEWMGHRDIETTQVYADYAPSAQEHAYVEAAFGAVVPTVLAAVE